MSNNNHAETSTAAAADIAGRLATGSAVEQEHVKEVARCLAVMQQQKQQQQDDDDDDDDAIRITDMLTSILPTAISQCHVPIMTLYCCKLARAFMSPIMSAIQRYCNQPLLPMETSRNYKSLAICEMLLNHYSSGRNDNLWLLLFRTTAHRSWPRCKVDMRSSCVCCWNGMPRQQQQLPVVCDGVGILVCKEGTMSPNSGIQEHELCFSVGKTFSEGDMKAASSSTKTNSSKSTNRNQPVLHLHDNMLD